MALQAAFSHWAVRLLRGRRARGARPLDLEAPAQVQLPIKRSSISYWTIAPQLYPSGRSSRGRQRSRSNLAVVADRRQRVYALVVVLRDFARGARAGRLLDRNGCRCAFRVCGLQLPPPVVPLAQLLPPDEPPLPLPGSSRSTNPRTSRSTNPRTNRSTNRSTSPRTNRSTNPRTNRSTNLKTTRCCRRCPRPRRCWSRCHFRYRRRCYFRSRRRCCRRSHWRWRRRFGVVPAGPPSGPGPTPTAVSPTSSPRRRLRGRRLPQGQ